MLPKGENTARIWPGVVVGGIEPIQSARVGADCVSRDIAPSDGEMAVLPSSGVDGALVSLP